MKFSLLKNKKILTVVCSLFLVGNIFAYNPPVQGENLTSFINPNQMTSGFSVAGGALFNITPSSIMTNPSLGAYQDRVGLDFGYTGIITGDNSEPYAQAFGTGIIIPTRWFNFSGELFGVFSPTEKMQLGNSLNLKTTISKEVAENFAIGLGVGGGTLWGIGNDWNLVADVGAVYNWGSLGPMNNFRLGAAVLNLGKVYNNNFAQGINHKNNQNQWDTFPGFMTVKVGAAAEFINTQDFVLGLSLDVSTPFFSNMIFDSGVQMIIWDFLKINSGWQFDMRSLFAGKQSWLPTFGVSFKFSLDTGFIKNENWQKSELEVGTSYKNVTGGINAFSIGANINLGQQDTAAPDILINAEMEE